MAWQNWNEDGAGEIPRTPLRAIRAKCIDCCCGSPYEPANCTATSCPLYAYRDGHDPNKKGKGNNSSIKKINEERARLRRISSGETAKETSA